MAHSHVHVPKLYRVAQWDPSVFTRTSTSVTTITFHSLLNLCHNHHIPLSPEPLLQQYTTYTPTRTHTHTHTHTQSINQSINQNIHKHTHTHTHTHTCDAHKHKNECKYIITCCSSVYARTDWPCARSSVTTTASNAPVAATTMLRSLHLAVTG